MSDLQFYNVPLQGKASLGSRIVRRLAMPFFARLSSILEAIREHLLGLDRRFEHVVSVQSDVRLEVGQQGLNLNALKSEYNRLTERFEQIEDGFQGRNERKDERFSVLNGTLASLNDKLDKINGKFDNLNEKFDHLNEKLENLNQKFEYLDSKFESMIVRQNGLEEGIASVKALHWDHVALSRRLAQLEDRLLETSDQADGQDEPDESGSSIPFPGFDRLDKERVG